MPVWQVGFEGETFEWDDESLMLSEAREIKKWLSGMTPPQWFDLLTQDDPDAATALICILRRRAGHPELRFTEVDGDLKTLTFLHVDDDVADEQEEPNPTQDVA